VATIARDDTVDIVVEVPGNVAKYITPGMPAKVVVAGMKKEWNN